jgi:esterase
LEQHPDAETVADTNWRLDLLMAAVEVSGVEVSAVVLPTDHDILVDRMRLHYLDWGAPANPAIVFLHGGGLTAHTWDVVCLALRDRFHCIALDLRGHGESEWSPKMDYSLDTHARDLRHFVDNLGLEKLVLVGMSLGGLISIAFSALHPGRVQALVIVDVGPEVQSAGVRRISQFAASSEELDSVDDFVKLALSFNPARNPTLLRRSLLHNLHQLPNGKWTWRYDKRPRIVGDLDAADQRRRLLWKEIAAIQCPTLVVRGAQSDVFADADAERLAATLPNGRWIKVEAAGHTIQGDNPRGLLQALEPFLSQVG